MSQSGLTQYQDECLEILAEECAELIQEKSKIFRFGCHEDSHHIIGKTHAECLEQELGDVLAMIELVQQSGIGISVEGLAAAKARKLEKVINWMIYKHD
jgi:NTP pyrophosphatase (non-canonical NTP hydrolase)